MHNYSRNMLNELPDAWDLMINTNLNHKQAVKYKILIIASVKSAINNANSPLVHDIA